MSSYYVEMTLNGKSVPGSTVRSGTLAECNATAARLNKRKGKLANVKWQVLPCK